MRDRRRDLDRRHARDAAASSAGSRTASSRGAFAHTLIPIAAGYLVAHYFSLLAYNGQDLWRLANDPLGKGSDLFGGAERGIDYGVVSATGIWYVQVARARARPRRRAGARARPRARALRLGPKRGDPLAGRHAGADGAFTCLGLWLLSAALNA